nr:hypothetical protein [bacterium]
VQSGTAASSIQDGRLEIAREGNTFRAFYIDKQTGERKPYGLLVPVRGNHQGLFPGCGAQASIFNCEKLGVV